MCHPVKALPKPDDICSMAMVGHPCLLFSSRLSSPAIHCAGASMGADGLLHLPISLSFSTRDDDLSSSFCRCRRVVGWPYVERLQLGAVGIERVVVEGNELFCARGKSNG